MNRTLLVLAAAGALATASTEASAHAHLTSATPAANATVAAPKQLTLHFSEKLMPRLSSLSLVMPRMKNMAVPAKVAVGQDGKTLVATPQKALAPGAYKVAWHAVTADTHRVQGVYSFTVK